MFKHYYYVETTDSKIWLHADSARVENGGVLCFYSDNTGLITAFPAGVWQYARAASFFTGESINIQHWDALYENPLPVPSTLSIGKEKE